MNADEFAETVRADNETALSRLGSSKSLYAITAGEMDAETVLAAAAAAADAASERFADWAEEGTGDAAEVFTEVAEIQADHREQLVAELEDEAAVEDAETPAVVAVLGEFDETVGRTGGLVGWAIATKKATEQYTGFFVGQADPGTAGVFREFGDDIDAHVNRGVAILAEVCGTDEEWEVAREAAADVIQAGYEEYTETLEGLGVNPKPVC